MINIEKKNKQLKPVEQSKEEPKDEPKEETKKEQKDEVKDEPVLASNTE